jgi:endogenous inhibitor of DNA gyrase (YacG/DUF329 family)
MGVSGTPAEEALRGTGLSLACDNCGRPLGALPPTARHKRFCSDKCRNEWHLAKRKRALQALAKMEQEQANGN